MMVHLVSEQGKIISLGSGNLLLGRGSLLGIDDRKLSRYQALIIVSESGAVQLLFIGKNPMYLVKKDDDSSLQKRLLKKGQLYLLQHGDRFCLLQDKYWFTVHLEQHQQRQEQQQQQQHQNLKLQWQSQEKTLQRHQETQTYPSTKETSSLSSDKCIQKFRNIVPSPKKPTTPSLILSTVSTACPSKRVKLEELKDDRPRFMAPLPPPPHILSLPQEDLTQTQISSLPSADTINSTLSESNVLHGTSQTDNGELFDPIDSDSNNSDQFPFELSQKRKREDEGLVSPTKRLKTEEEIPECYHKLPAIIKYVTKEGPSKGKRYWTCGMVSGRCDFFQWFGAPKCEHGLPCTRLTVKKEGINQGRQFWTCAQTDRCRTFRWIKEGE
jgi:hypothetical protein